MTLRPYQYQAITAINSGWSEYRRQLLVLPTGTGKTIVFSNLAAQEAERGGCTLILAHRDELLQQAQDKLRIATGLDSALEKAENKAYQLFRDDLFSERPSVVVGSVQSLGSSRLSQWQRDTFDLVIIDEAHHVLSDSYKGIIEWFNDARLLGVTATPDRGDKRNLGAVFDNIAYEYSMAAAIRDGYLSPISAKLLPLEIDLSAVRTVAGDYNVADLDDGIAPYLRQVAREVAANIEDRKTLVFLPLVRTSEMFAEFLCEEGIAAKHIDGQSPDRADLLAQYAKSKFQVLCNSSLLLEGYDCPDIACIVCLRPTKVRSLYQQMIGRGTRIAPGKTDLRILDFLWLSTEHSLCVPASLFARSLEESSQMMDLVARGSVGGGQVDLLQAQSDAQAQREATLAKRLEEQKRKKARMLNPIEFALSLHDADLMEYEPTMPWHMAAVTDKQVALLEKFGIDPNLTTCKGHASAIIDRLLTRRRMGLCTPKQASTLQRYGYDAATLTFDDAKLLLDELASNGWRRAG